MVTDLGDFHEDGVDSINGRRRGLVRCGRFAFADNGERLVDRCDRRLCDLGGRRLCGLGDRRLCGLGDQRLCDLGDQRLCDLGGRRLCDLGGRRLCGLGGRRLCGLGDQRLCDLGGRRLCDLRGLARRVRAMTAVSNRGYEHLVRVSYHPARWHWGSRIFQAHEHFGRRLRIDHSMRSTASCSS